MIQMFSYVNQHSYHYFQNNFAGSLINKITDMQHGVVDILTTLDDLYAQALGISVCYYHFAIHSSYFCADFNRMGFCISINYFFFSKTYSTTFP